MRGECLINTGEFGNINPSAIYEEHNKQFQSISTWLGSYYDGYANSDKIISLLSYWLYAYRCILACYGIEGAKDFCKSGFGSHIRFAYSYEYGVDVNLKPRKFISGFLFHIAAGFINTAYLPGGRVRSISTKIAWRVTKFAAMSAPIAVRNIRKQALINKLLNCFDGCDVRVLEKNFDDALPAVFVADQINLITGKALRVDCSAVSFMDFCGYENILLFNRRLRIMGRQHGGGYDMFSVDYFSLFEKTLCDTFMGWGMSGKNERQHKYPIGTPFAMPAGSEKRLIWVERGRCPLIWLPLIPTVFAQCNNRSAVEYVYNELLAVDRGFFSLAYPGQLKSPDYGGMRGAELGDNSGKGENVICANDIVIFDISAASLIHYCIEHEITFIVVICRGDIAHFTEIANEWLDILRRSGLAFFDDEVGLLSRRLGEILADDCELPADVRKYHRERFIDIR